VVKHAQFGTSRQDIFTASEGGPYGPKQIMMIIIVALHVHVCIQRRLTQSDSLFAGACAVEHPGSRNLARLLQAPPMLMPAPSRASWSLVSWSLNCILLVAPMNLSAQDSIQASSCRTPRRKIKPELQLLRQSNCNDASRIIVGRL